MLAQNTPNLVVGNVFQRRSQQDSIQECIALGRRLIQSRLDTPFGLQFVSCEFARPRCILQPDHPVAQKPATPLASRGWPRLHSRCDLLIAGPGRRAQKSRRQELRPAPHWLCDALPNPNQPALQA